MFNAAANHVTCESIFRRQEPIHIILNRDISRAQFEEAATRATDDRIGTGDSIIAHRTPLRLTVNDANARNNGQPVTAEHALDVTDAHRAKTAILALAQYPRAPRSAAIAGEPISRKAILNCPVQDIPAKYVAYKTADELSLAGFNVYVETESGRTAKFARSRVTEDGIAARRDQIRRSVSESRNLVAQSGELRNQIARNHQVLNGLNRSIATAYQHAAEIDELNRTMGAMRVQHQRRLDRAWDGRPNKPY